jgi:hypothetical protein
MSRDQVQIGKKKQKLAGKDTKQRRTGFRCKCHAVVQLVESLRYKPEGREFDFRWGSLKFLIDLYFWPHFDPGIESASNKNEYQGYLLGDKIGRCVGLTT